MIGAFKNGFSIYEIHRSIGVTQKTGWFTLHRIREGMHEDSRIKPSGEAKTEETSLGGEARTMHLAKRARRIPGTGTKDKVGVTTPNVKIVR